MTGDDARAEALAAYIEEGVLADDIAPLEPALRHLIDLIDRLAPHPERVQALSQLLFATPAPPLTALARVRIPVTDMTAALAFYRDALGLAAGRSTRTHCKLDAGAATLVLERVPSRRPASEAAPLALEFRTSDLDAAVAALRECGVAVRVAFDPSRQRSAELQDPDGHAIILRAGTSTSRR